MVPCRRSKAIERHQQKQKMRRLKQAQQKINNRRQKIVDSVASHFEKTNLDWQSLSQVIEKLTRIYAVEGLFSQKQRDKLSFKKDEQETQKMTREPVGPRKGSFHVTFFALASGFRGVPHDHHGVHCVSGVLAGPFTEIIYTADKNGAITQESMEGACCINQSLRQKYPFFPKIVKP